MLCVCTYYMSVHVQYTIHSGVGIIVLATSDWVMHVSVVYSKNVEKLTYGTLLYICMFYSLTFSLTHVHVQCTFVLAF